MSYVFVKTPAGKSFRTDIVDDDGRPYTFRELKCQLHKQYPDDAGDPDNICLSYMGEECRDDATTADKGIEEASTLFLLNTVLVVKAEAADILPDDTVQWMWGDANVLGPGLFEKGHALAQANPLHWSLFSQLVEAIVDLAKHKDVKRPVEIRTNRAMAILPFDTVEQALLALQKHSAVYPPRPQPQVPFTGKALQKELFPEVVMKMPKNGKVVAKVPNGEVLTVLEVDGDGPNCHGRVRWKETEGWVKMYNVAAQQGQPMQQTMLLYTIGQEVEILRSNGGWSAGVVKSIAEGFIEVQFEDDGAWKGKQVPMFGEGINQIRLKTSV